MNEIEQSSSIIATKVYETTLAILTEDFFTRFPAIAEDFEREASKLLETGQSGFEARYNNLLEKFLEKLGYSSRMQHLIEAQTEALLREQQEMNLYFKVMGRDALIKEYGRHEILMKGVN